MVAAAAIFLIIEIATPSLVFACFVVGSVASAVIAYLYPEAYLWQIGVFAVISMILIPPDPSPGRKITVESPQKSNVDAMVDRPGLVVKTIDPDKDTDRCASTDRMAGQAAGKIEEGAKIKVTGITGARLMVKKIEE
jgi:membrane protein implicated in regulation of membrane protease activity